MVTKPTVIALEEHYLDHEVKPLGGPGAGPEIVRRLEDLGELRLKEMDEAGIDFQVLSHSIPGLQGVDAGTGVPLARRVNDRLHEAVQRSRLIPPPGRVPGNGPGRPRLSSPHTEDAQAPGVRHSLSDPFQNGFSPTALAAFSIGTAKDMPA